MIQNLRNKKAKTHRYLVEEKESGKNHYFMTSEEAFNFVDKLKEKNIESELYQKGWDTLNEIAFS